MVKENQTPTLKALKPIPLTKMAYDSLRESIINGHLAPGEVFAEATLAKKMEISRTPVREALLELASNGLVTYLPRKGVVVNKFSEEDAQEIFQVRMAVEFFCVEQVTKSHAELDLQSLREAFERQSKALAKNDMRRFITGDRDFHTGFAELLNNHRLCQILDNVRDQIQIMSLGALGNPGRVHEVMEEHRRILAGVESGDVKAAREAIADHLKKSHEAVIAGCGT